MALSEKALIAQIRRIAAAASPKSRDRRVRVGIGDDCALLSLPAGHETLVTTDFSLEGIHFLRDWHSPESVGHRCLARGLSDIAAMGGEPVATFLSLALPRKLPPAWARAFLAGLLKLARTYGVALAGGDTAESPGGILADITLIGTVPRGTAILRSGARPGDFIYVSGALGGSAAVLRSLQLGRGHAGAKTQQYRRHFFPEPRIAVGRALREKSMASAMIDTSDGLSTDLAHICEESNVGAQIEAALVPQAHSLGRAKDLTLNLNLALHGGEDYELLFTARPGKRVPALIAGVPVTRIGHITRMKKVLLRDAAGRISKLAPLGWEHFRS
jgi:thiamine-monophosphate kinase